MAANETTHRRPAEEEQVAEETAAQGERVVQVEEAEGLEDVLSDPAVAPEERH